MVLWRYKKHNEYQSNCDKSDICKGVFVHICVCMCIESYYTKTMSTSSLLAVMGLVYDD